VAVADVRHPRPPQTRQAQTAQAQTPQAQSRRRGETLRTAIHAAVLDELAASGFAGLSIERVAERARTGKACIYRRWPSRLELVLDALDASMPQLEPLPDTGSTRDDLLLVLRHVAGVMSSRCGHAASACIAPGVDDELSAAIRRRLLAPRKAALLDLLRRGVTRDEVRPDAVCERMAEIGPALLQGELMQRGAIRDDAVVAIVDQILMPLVRP
jgi:AcrR family transcriptional regulator